MSQADARHLADLIAAVARPRTRDEEALVAYWLRRLGH